MTSTPERDRLVAVAAERTAADDVEGAEQALRALLEVLGPDDPILARTRTTLGAVLRRQWESGVRPDGLDAAIAMCRAAVTASPPDRAMCLANLGNALLTRGTGADLDEAVPVLTEASALSPRGTATHAPYLMNLGAALAALGRLRPSGDSLDRGIDTIERAVAAAAGDRYTPSYLANLADALRTRFQRTFDGTDIGRAVQAAREAVEAAPTAAFRSILGSALLDRYRVAGDRRDLDEAVDHLIEACQATPPGHQLRARRMAGLAAAFRHRAEADQNQSDLVRAEALLLAAQKLTPTRSFLVNLSAVLILRAQWTGDDVVLERAIEVARAVDPMNLATALHLRARRTGSLTDLDEAATAARNTADHVSGQTGLAAILLTRYLRAARGADLDHAVDAAGAAVAGTRTGDPDLPGRISNLGSLLRLRGARTRSIDDLDEAVRRLTEVVIMARTGLAGHLSNLGAALLSRDEITGDDAAAALSVLRRAAEITTAGSADRPLLLSNLGNALARAGDPRQACDMHREALGMLPAGHPDRTVVLGNLAAALDTVGDEAARDEALQVTREITVDPVAAAQDRLLAAWRLADLEIRGADGDVSAGAQPMRAAVELAERAAWLGVAAADRAYTLVRFSSLAMDAAAAIARTDPAEAVSVLESGRGVGWQDLMRLRRADDLARRSPALADRLRAAGAGLDQPTQ